MERVDLNCDFIYLFCEIVHIKLGLVVVDTCKTWDTASISKLWDMLP